jgi:hypothetical protein
MNGNMYKTEIWISFNYGGWNLVFSKKFELRFVPFFGLQLTETVNGDYENEIKLNNNDYTITTIDYNINNDQFDIDIRNHWKYPVSDETIDDTIKNFKLHSWDRHDNTNIDDLKELMLRERKS